MTNDKRKMENENISKYLPDRLSHTRSIMVATAWPPPMQSVINAVPRPRRSSSSIAVPRSIALGPPLGATGAMLLGTAIDVDLFGIDAEVAHSLHRHDGE